VTDIIVRSGFIPAPVVRAALDSWPAGDWYEYGPHKKASVPGTLLPEPIAKIIHALAVLPLSPLVPDLGLWGAGLHQMPPGPGLRWHVDSRIHAALRLARRRTAVVYLCGDGDLEFRSGVRVPPAPGRLVLFDGSEPHRVLPVTTDRKSVTLFYYGGPADGNPRADFTV
jgi:hypothetical protein